MPHLPARRTAALGGLVLLPRAVAAAARVVAAAVVLPLRRRQLAHALLLLLPPVALAARLVLRVGVLAVRRAAARLLPPPRLLPALLGAARPRVRALLPVLLLPLLLALLLLQLLALAARLRRPAALLVRFWLLKGARPRGIGVGVVRMQVAPPLAQLAVEGGGQVCRLREGR
jgi:hypothetical protein